MSRQRQRSVVSGEWPDPHELIERARALVEAIQGFIHLTPAERLRINTAASLPNDFYSTGAVILDQYEWLATASDLTGEEVRRMLEETPGYTSLASELELLARGIRSSLASRRGAVGRRLLLMYEIARRANREGEGTYIQEVETLQEILRSRRRTRKREETPEPEPPLPDSEP
jgi:hypothetical protein